MAEVNESLIIVMHYHFYVKELCSGKSQTVDREQGNLEVDTALKWIF